MKAKFITSKRNKGGEMWLNFGEGLNRHELIEMEDKEVEIALPRDATPEYEAGFHDGAKQGKQQFYEAVLKLIREQPDQGGTCLKKDDPGDSTFVDNQLRKHCG